MAVELRGGIPRVFRGTIQTTGYDTAGHRFAAVTKYVRIRNYGANVLRVYFLEEDYTNDAGYLEVANGTVVEGPMELERIWLRAVSGATDVEILSFARRG